MYSEVVDGKVLDHKYKKISDNAYAFYIGDKYLGQAHRMKKSSWSALADMECDMRLVNGFRARKDAVEYILSIFRKKR